MKSVVTQLHVLSDLLNCGPTSLIMWKAAPSEIVKKRLMTASKLRPIPVVYALIRGKLFDLIRFVRRLRCLWTGLCGVHAQYLQINRCTIPPRFSRAWQKAQISINLRSSPHHPSPFPIPRTACERWITEQPSFCCNFYVVVCSTVCLPGWQRFFLSALRPATFDSKTAAERCTYRIDAHSLPLSQSSDLRQQLCRDGGCRHVPTKRGGRGEGGGRPAR